MATKSFRIFATKEDLFSIFFDFQQNVKIHYFKCGRMYDLVEISDITKDTLFGINQKGNLLNSQWLVCYNDTMPLKRKNNMCLDNNIFFLDQEVNEYSAVINIGGVYEDKAPVSYTHLDVYKRQIESLVDTKWAGKNVVYYDEIDSTNNRAKEAGDNGAAHEMCIRDRCCRYTGEDRPVCQNNLQ